MGNVDGFSDSFNWAVDAGDKYKYLFSASKDVSSWPEGNYCFIFNPSEDGGESDIRMTEFFKVNWDEDNDGFTRPGDCNDANVDINPGATEICDGIDNNCDGNIDEGGICEYSCITPTTDIRYETLGLGVNRWVYDKGWITQKPKGKGTGPTFTPTLTDTHQCGCEQILTWLHANLPEQYGEMNGHWKYGCSQSAIQDFMRLAGEWSVFNATESFYYNGPTDSNGIYGSGPITFTWNPITGHVTGGYYTEQVPADTGTYYYNMITGGSVVGDNVELIFDRVNPYIYHFHFLGTLVGDTLSGMMDGPYLFTATRI